MLLSTLECALRRQHYQFSDVAYVHELFIKFLVISCLYAPFLVLFRLSSLFNVLFISCVLFIIKVYLKYSFFVCVTFTTKHAVLQNLEQVFSYILNKGSICSIFLGRISLLASTVCRHKWCHLIIIRNLHRTFNKSNNF